MASLNVFLDPLPPTVGRAMHRLSDALIRYAPANMNIVHDIHDASLQILQYWTSDLLDPRWLAVDDYVLWYHCANRLFDNLFPFNRVPEDVIRRARLVVSWQPLDIGPYQDKFLHLPLGADPGVFYPMPDEQKYFKVLTTGYVASTEMAEECYRAAYANGGMTVHVGNIPSPGPKWTQFENISDDMMRTLYCQSDYVSALREHEGFEMGGVESLMARGGRPLIFSRPDQSWYRKWAITIQEGPSAYVEEQLREVLSKPAIPVSEEERKEIVEQLSWANIAPRFWNRLLELV